MGERKRERARASAGERKIDKQRELKREKSVRDIVGDGVSERDRESVFASSIKDRKQINSKRQMSDKVV